MTGTGALVRTIGLRHLVERKLRTALTAGGIAAGVALVFSITSMNAALNDAVSATVGAFSGPADLQVTAIATGTLDADTADRIRAIDGITNAAPVLQARSELTADGSSSNAFVLGGTVDLLAFTTSADAPVADPRGIALGERLARRLDVAVGDDLRVGTPSGLVTLKVGGILPPGPTDRINGGLAAALPLPVAQGMFERRDQVDLVLIDTAPEADAATVRDAVRGVVGTAGVVTSPEDAPGDRSENVQPFLMLTEAIGMIALFVALVLVFNTMSMTMAERRGELALAAALGARRRQLFRAVLGEAALLGALGTAVGLALGALLANQILRVAGDAYRTVLPIDPPTSADLVGPHLVVAIVGGIGVAVLGAIVPARRVLRTAPIAALRPANDYEWAPDEHRRRIVPILGGLAVFAVGMGLGLGLDGGAPSMATTGLIVVTILAGITILLPTALPLVTDRLGRLLERRWGVVGRLAGDSLRANPRRTSITLATLILPLATVIGMGTAFSSTQAQFHDLAESFVGTPVVVTADSFLGYTAMQPLAGDVAEVLEDVPGVAAALPAQNMFLTTDDGFAILYATPLALAERKGVPEAITDSDNAEDPSAFRTGLVDGEIAVSRLTAKDRGVDTGDTLTLPTVDGPVAFRVATVFDDLAGVDTIYIDRDTFLRHWADDGANGFFIAIDDGADPSAVAAALTAAIDDLGLPAEVRLRDDHVADIEAGLSGLFSISRSIQLAAVVVAALSLMSTAFTTVLERRWTLGLQRALGMSRAQIARSLALEAAAVAVIGGLGASLLGIAIGVLLGQSFGIVAAVALPIAIPWPLIAVCAIGALALSLAATAYPRRLATRTQIIDALVTE